MVALRGVGGARKGEDSAGERDFRPGSFRGF